MLDTSESYEQACDDCSGDYYTCDPSTGQWDHGECEPPYVSVDGSLTLQLAERSATAGCPILPRLDPIVFAVVEGFPKTLTADAPIVVIESEIDDGNEEAYVRVRWTDGAGTKLDADLLVDLSYQVTGDATAYAGACTYELAVTGTSG